MKPFDVKIHMSLKKRKMWGHKMRLIFLGLIVILLLCSICFTFGAATWDPTREEWKPHPQYWWQFVLIVIGSLASIGSIAGFVIYSYLEIKRFYTSQMIYFATPEFAKARGNALKVDLALLKASNLKWYKKMGYISSQELKQAKEQQKRLKKEAKASNKSFVYAVPLLEQEKSV